MWTELAPRGRMHSMTASAHSLPSTDSEAHVWVAIYRATSVGFKLVSAAGRVLSFWNFATANSFADALVSRGVEPVLLRRSTAGDLAAAMEANQVPADVAAEHLDVAEALAIGPA